MVDYIHPTPCNLCGQYRAKDEFHVGRRFCAPCNDKLREGLYQPDMDTLIRFWEEEAAVAKAESIADGTAIVLDDSPVS